MASCPGDMRRTLTAALLGLALLAAACGTGDSKSSGAPASSQTITLYTSVTHNTVSAVVDAFTKAHPDVKVAVFRAPTGALNARIAADQRTGHVRGDIVWGTDPLSMHGYDAQGLLTAWTPSDAGNVPAAYRTTTFWGTRVLHMVLVYHRGLPRLPKAWADLADPDYRNQVVIPDPAFAGSAFAVLGYFDRASGYGLDFYRRLKANRATQVSSIDDVVTQVAQGRYQLGVTLDYSARAAMEKGSPIGIAWPSPGGIALYSPIGVFRASGRQAAARSFVDFVLSRPGQVAIAGTGWSPVLAGVPGPPIPATARTVSPDWSALFGSANDLLRRYRTVFGS